VSDGFRRSFAIHLRTQNSEVGDPAEMNEFDHAWVDHLDNPERCPIIFRR
jgi:hypothetical protein